MRKVSGPLQTVLILVSLVLIALLGIAVWVFFSFQSFTAQGERLAELAGEWTGTTHPEWALTIDTDGSARVATTFTFPGAQGDTFYYDAVDDVSIEDRGGVSYISVPLEQMTETGTGSRGVFVSCAVVFRVDGNGLVLDRIEKAAESEVTLDWTTGERFAR